MDGAVYMVAVHTLCYKLGISMDTGKSNDSKKEIAISFKNVSKTFGQVKASSNVSMDIYKGDDPHEYALGYILS